MTDLGGGARLLTTAPPLVIFSVPLAVIADHGVSVTHVEPLPSTFITPGELWPTCSSETPVLRDGAAIGDVHRPAGPQGSIIADA